MSIARMFGQRCTVEPFTDESARGALYGPAVSERCRVQQAATYQGANADRHEVDTSTVIYMRFSADCPVRSRITLPDGQVGIAAEVHKHAGRPAVRHLKVVVR